MKYRERPLIVRFLLLMTGLSLCAVSTVLTVSASLGLSPWDIFHQGLHKVLGITIGQASIWVGAAIILLNFIFREKVGIGTVINTFYIGYLMDVIFRSGIIPNAHGNVPLGLLMMFSGIANMGIGSFLYLSAGMGAGPRDGLMVVLTKKSGYNIAYVRNIIEIAVSLIGWLLGGQLGAGTLIYALTIGFSVRFFFGIFKFDVHELQHDYLDSEGILNILGLDKVKGKDN